MTQKRFGLSAPDVRHVCRLVTQTAKLMCGMPDYETYAAHRREKHPGEPVMTREEFFRERQRARYADGTGRGARCC